jgi:UDP-N-acetyl-D-glucosamine dehydrogenase
LRKKGFKIGEEVFLAYSPERIDTGNERYTVNNIPKVLSGVTRNCTEMVRNLYSIICEQLYTVSSPRIAETTKLLENTFRSVNIPLINEFAQLCNRIGIDIWEVVEAASTKPFGFMSFYPGPGIGGHCIPVVPLFLSRKAKLHNFNTRLIDLSDDINRKMPEYVLHRLFQVLNDRRKSIKDSKILILGVSYKENIGDIRESPALEIIKLILENGGDVIYNDGKLWKSVKINEKLLKECDVILIINKHRNYDWTKIVKFANCVLDCRNATKGILSDKVYKL